RAVAANPEAARMAGVPAGRMSVLTWALAGGLATYTAVLILPTHGFGSVDFLGPGLLVRALAAAVIGRVVNLPTALAAGTGLGGQLSLGQFALAGVGATVSYVIVANTGNFALGLLCAGLLGGAVSLVIGIPAMRVRGLMLAVASMGFALAAEGWLFQQPWML